MPTSTLMDRILDSLKKVIDPETGMDVIRMRLVQDLVVQENGNVKYSFRPSSHLCPLAVPIAMSIVEAVANVDGVTHQDVSVVDYVQSEQLSGLLNGYINGYML